MTNDDAAFVRADAGTTEATDGLDAERNSAFTIGVLHYFVVFSAPALLWNSPVIDRRILTAWTLLEAVLGLVSFAAFLSIRAGHVDRFVRLAQVESAGTALTFGALAWLGDDVATSTPSKHVLMIALIAVTSISASNSSHITRRRPFFGKLIVIVAVSYSAAFLLHGELIFAALTVLWCASIAVLTRVGYRGMVELLELRQASEKAARHDHLTGLLSRAAFFALIDNASGSDLPTPAGAGGPDVVDQVLVLFDLDGFKGINDSFGHAAGDAVLQVVANRLTATLPPGAAIARLGGDEFAALFQERSAALVETVEHALVALTEPIPVADRELYVAASAGWTVVDHHGTTADLLAEADAAMYQSKASMTTASTAFDANLRHELARSLDLRQRFRTALRRREIEFCAQPLVRTSDRSPIAVELLARWPQLDASVVGPIEFTRVAEETGLAIELDRQALAAARLLLEAWQDDPLLSQIVVKANISPVHLNGGELLQSVSELIPVRLRERLGLEFVESRLISTAERNHMQMRHLMDMGITLSIDDFGVGYSSLTYLRRLPISEIKIDRSFVSKLDSDPINQGLIRAIVDIAATLGLPTVAEGIETQRELDAAHRLGVSAGQGYLIGRPAPIDEISTVLRDLHGGVSLAHT